MADRKIYATVEGTIAVPVRVKREVIVRVDEGGDFDAAIRAAAQGENGGDDWSLVDCGDCELQDGAEEVDATLDCVDDANFSVDDVTIDDSK